MICTSTDLSFDLISKANKIRFFAKDPVFIPDGSFVDWEGSHESFVNGRTSLVMLYRAKGKTKWNKVEYTVDGVYTADQIKEKFLSDPLTNDPEHWFVENSDMYFCDITLRELLDRRHVSEEYKRQHLERYYASMRIPA